MSITISQLIVLNVVAWAAVMFFLIGLVRLKIDLEESTNLTDELTADYIEENKSLKKDIERLKRECLEVETIGCYIQDETGWICQLLQDKDTEIERLRAENNAHEKGILEKEVVQKQADKIERLKEYIEGAIDELPESPDCALQILKHSLERDKK